MVIFTWICGILYFNNDFKSKFYVNTDKEFMHKFESYFDSANAAKSDLVKWLGNKTTNNIIKTRINFIFF